MSDTTSAIPMIDDANDASLPGLIAQMIKNNNINLEDCMPATVISYDRSSNVASIQPQIHMVATDGTAIKRGPLAKIPVLTLGGGGFIINFPVTGGSRGWIKATDRDMSLYMQSMSAQPPNTSRLHSFSDSFFIPDVVSGFTIDGEDTNNMVIQNTAGTYRIALWPDRVKITTPVCNLQLRDDRVRLTMSNPSAPFEVDAQHILFATTPIIGALPPLPS